MTLTNKLKEMRRQEEGFTIVELLIVIVVIAILAALVITSYLGIQGRARDSERQSDIRAVVTAVQADATLNDGQYPQCSAVASVENIDTDAITPPGQDPASGFSSTAPAGQSDAQYYCASNPDSPAAGARVDGLLFGYWSEAEGEPVYRGVGDAPAEPS